MKDFIDLTAIVIGGITLILLTLAVVDTENRFDRLLSKKDKIQDDCLALLKLSVELEEENLELKRESDRYIMIIVPQEGEESKEDLCQ